MRFPPVRVRSSLPCVAVVLLACATTTEPPRQAFSEGASIQASRSGSAKPDDSRSAAVAGQDSTEPAAAVRSCEMFAKPGLLKRGALIRLLDAGLPRWLQGVEGDRSLANHRFQGWLVKSIYPGDPCYKDLDLRAGDVVQKVNGKSIERPEQAFDVAESLRTASSLTVDYLRDGRIRHLSISITSDP